MTILRAGKLIAGLTICIHLGACSLFDTREPEPPDRGDGSAFIQPDQPRDVIDNLVNAIASLNQVNYLRCLSDLGFEYTPTNQAQNNAPEIWVSWNKQDEEIYFSNLRSSAENFQGHQLQFSNENYSQDSGNTQLYTADYVLSVEHSRISASVPTVATGSLRMTLSTGEDGLWAIESWTDIPDSDRFSWSNMRATFR